VVLAFLGAIVVAHEVLDKPLLVFIVEPASIGTNIWYAGVLSTTGGLLWWTAASVSYVTAWISRVTGVGAAGFWLGLAVLTTVLAWTTSSRDTRSSTACTSISPRK